jgi:DNA-binding response OmpR family regulator
MTDRLKVLLVDDEVDIMHVMKKGIEKYGYAVDSFIDPRKALSHFKPNTYHAIVLDVRMPGIGGFYLAKQIWALDAKANICFLSAFEIYAAEAKLVFTDFKSYCFIKKPITPAELVTHIQAHLMTAK